MEKNRLLSENTWYEWYHGLINHFPESMKKSESNIKEKTMNIFPKEYKPKDYKPKQIADVFDDKCIE